MTVIEIIYELQSSGHDVEYRKRPDGGYIITEINGEKFTGAHGNTRARNITGATLSEARAEQVAFNVQKYIKGQKKVTAPIDEEVIKELRKTQRAWNKARKGSGKDFGRVTKRKLRYKLKAEGRTAALSYLRRMRAHAQGIAYSENVMHLVSRMRRIIGRIHPNLVNEFESLLNTIENMAESFAEKWIAPINEIIYNMENMPTEGEQKTAINQIKSIISA